MIDRGILAFADGPEGAALVHRRVAGLSLLERGIRTLARAGVRDLIVLLPRGARPRLSRLTHRLDIRLEFATWGSAPTLLAGGDFALVRGDCVHHHSGLSELLAGGLQGADLVVHTSEAPPRNGPLSGLTPAGELAFSAGASGGPVSTGAFLCAAHLFAPAELAGWQGELETFVAERAKGRRVERRPASPALWRRVCDRRGARAAKNMLFGQVTKSTSGFVSRHINARISIPTSKLLVETGLSPHAITVLLVLTTGLASAWLVSRADEYRMLLLAGVLWQFAAVFDRCDGEVARVRLCESKFGAWFDTVTDNIAYICAYVGLLVGMHRLYPAQPLYIYLGLSAIAALLITLFVMYSYARRTGSGSLQHYLRALSQEIPESEKGLLQKAMERYGFVAKRDFFSFFIFLCCAVGYLQIAYWFLIGILHSAAISVIFSQHKMMQGYLSARSRSRRAAVPALETMPPSASIEDRP